MTMAATQIASSDLHALSIAEASELIRRKALSPVELTQALLDRAALLDPKIHAYLRVTPDLALKQARLAEREIMADNHRGAMHGIPYGAKDVFATAGIATTGHSKAYADFVPPTDATARWGALPSTCLGRPRATPGASHTSLAALRAGPPPAWLRA
jgi:aspartyl-tRNA(Asn)/glutamyl-tRNA(Gln) amidotransferase subunit A